MHRAALAVAALAAVAAAVLLRRARPALDVAPQSMEPGPVPDDWTAQAFPELEAQHMPQDSSTDRAARNLAAARFMVKKAEGTAGEGGYGALFGWPRIDGRSFDPATIGGHPAVFFNYTDRAGKTVRTSAAGAYQITYTTWTSYRLAFLAWAGLNGRSTEGFTPATQDAFFDFLLWRDGALDAVKAGRINEAVSIMGRRWASLPGAGANNPERSLAFVVDAFRSAGGEVFA